MKRAKEYLVWILIGLVFVTASMDIVLVVNVSGFNVRFALLVIMLLETMWFIQIVRSRRVFLVPGWGWLVLFALLNTIFALNSSLWSRSLGYALWLWVLVFWVIGMMNMVARSSWEKENVKERFLGKLLVVYMLSFLPALVMGWLQWVVPSLGWIREGLWRTQGVLSLFGEYSLYRVNGWSYEPSYYATYLIVLPPLLWVWFRQSRGIQKIAIALYLLLAVFMIVLSTSRMAWIALFLEGLSILVVEMWLWMRHRWAKKYIRWLLVVVPLVGIIGGVGGMFFLPWEKVLARVLRYSYFERMESIQNTLEVFFRHPFVSVSLGGVAPDIALFRGNIVPQNNQDVKPFEGISVFFELLSGTGIMGMFFLAGFIATLVFIIFRFWKRLSGDSRPWLMALVLGLGVQLGLLFLNQNLLRVYVWNHLSLFFAFLVGIEERITMVGGEDLSDKWIRVGGSFLSGILGISIVVVAFIFQPFFVELEGIRIKARFLLSPQSGRAYYNTGRGFWGYEALPFLLENDGASFFFHKKYGTEAFLVSKRYFDKKGKEAKLVWERVDLFRYTPILLEELERRDTRYFETKERLVDVLNSLLEDEGFWRGAETHISLSFLTRKYQKQKGKKGFDPVRYHRLLLEDWCVWIPRNPEGHTVYDWLFEFSYPIEWVNKPVEDLLVIEGIEIFTGWGKFFLPWKPDIWKQSSSDNTFSVRMMFSWKDTRIFVQAQYTRVWRTIVAGCAGVVAVFLFCFFVKRREEKNV